VPTLGAAPVAANPYAPGSVYAANTATAQVAATPTAVLPNGVVVAATPQMAATTPGLLPTTTTGLAGPGVVGVTPVGVGGMAAPATAPAATLLPNGLLPADINTMNFPPPPLARAHTHSPPIPAGQSFSPLWPSTFPLAQYDSVVSFTLDNTPDDIFWATTGLRESLAKAAGVPVNNLYYYNVGPTSDGTATAAKIVIRGTAGNQQNIIGSLSTPAAEQKLKNVLENFNLYEVGDTLKAQTSFDFNGGGSTAAGTGATTGLATTGLATTGLATTGLATTGLATTGLAGTSTGAIGGFGTPSTTGAVGGFGTSTDASTTGMGLTPGAMDSSASTSSVSGTLLPGSASSMSSGSALGSGSASAFGTPTGSATGTSMMSLASLDSAASTATASTLAVVLGLAALLLL